MIDHKPSAVESAVRWIGVAGTNAMRWGQRIHQCERLESPKTRAYSNALGSAHYSRFPTSDHLDVTRFFVPP
jgi:hypothetical protein